MLAMSDPDKRELDAVVLDCLPVDLPLPGRYVDSLQAAALVCIIIHPVTARIKIIPGAVYFQPTLFSIFPIAVTIPPTSAAYLNPAFHSPGMASCHRFLCPSIFPKRRACSLRLLFRMYRLYREPQDCQYAKQQYGKTKCPNAYTPLGHSHHILLLPLQIIYYR